MALFESVDAGVAEWDGTDHCLSLRPVLPRNRKKEDSQGAAITKIDKGDIPRLLLVSRVSLLRSDAISIKYRRTGIPCKNRFLDDIVDMYMPRS
jgi:hypothetical protein